ncbi:hypothetical protein [Urbifossiella limnaea]|uniref:Uncharacterized protein n=1 Tax=Urbifossiella limnaea TaxID=2528023 RepID=A0A517XQG1_9BACT|nr:hypothetical protein [Urbifossiella limnaea]QDU19726.1 hypothetical protein ETAA1_16620 [Urbifossiella limnaea]
MKRNERPARLADEDGTRYLVVDRRFSTPITILLDLDPTAEPGFPGFAVREVTLDPPGHLEGSGVSARDAIGRDPGHLDQFRSFPSDRAVARAGFILIEPRYVGPNWSAYVLAFKPDGERPQRR